MACARTFFDYQGTFYYPPPPRGNIFTSMRGFPCGVTLFHNRAVINTLSLGVIIKGVFMSMTMTMSKPL